MCMHHFSPISFHEDKVLLELFLSHKLFPISNYSSLNVPRTSSFDGKRRNDFSKSEINKENYSLSFKFDQR